jgi:hypothetical protein
MRRASWPYGAPRPREDGRFQISYVHSTFSGLRFVSDLNDAYAKGYVSKVPHCKSLFNHFEMPALTPIIGGPIAVSSVPLKVVEMELAPRSGTTVTSTLE